MGEVISLEKDVVLYICWFYYTIDVCTSPHINYRYHVNKHIMQSPIGSFDDRRKTSFSKAQLLPPAQKTIKLRNKMHMHTAPQEFPFHNSSLFPYRFSLQTVLCLWLRSQRHGIREACHVEPSRLDIAADVARARIDRSDEAWIAILMSFLITLTTVLGPVVLGSVEHRGHGPRKVGPTALVGDIGIEVPAIEEGLNIGALVCARALAITVDASGGETIRRLWWGRVGVLASRMASFGRIGYVGWIVGVFRGLFLGMWEGHCCGCQEGEKSKEARVLHFVSCASARGGFFLGICLAREAKVFGYER